MSYLTKIFSEDLTNIDIILETNISIFSGEFMTSRNPIFLKKNSL